MGPEEDEPRDEGARPRRPNVGGSQRATRLAALFVAVLAVLFVGFLLYARTVPGGTAPAASNGLLLFSGMFVGFAVVGVVYTLHPAPRAVEVEADHVTVVGRWGRRLRLPSLERLSVSVVRRYQFSPRRDGPFVAINCGAIRQSYRELVFWPCPRRLHQRRGAPGGYVRIGHGCGGWMRSASCPWPSR